MSETAHTFPVPKSKVIKGLEWTSERYSYPIYKVLGDTYPMTWGPDGEIYASSGDPGWGQSNDGLDMERFVGDPIDYRIEKVNEMFDYTGHGGIGPKPSGMISVRGMLYLAVQNLLGKKPPAHGTNSQHGTDASIVSSDDLGKTWRPGRYDAPMFPGNLFGGPAFINFGKDNAGARDSFVYAVSTDQWDNGSHLRLGRVPDDKVMDRSAWEWVLGYKDGNPIWTKELAAAVPILSDDRYISLPDMVYIAGIKRYLLLTWRLYQDFSCKAGTELIMYDSPEPWGPFTLAYHQPVWEFIKFNPYGPRIPLKWMDADGKSGWLQFSGSWNWGENQNIFYRSHVRKFRLILH